MDPLYYTERVYSICHMLVTMQKVVKVYSFRLESSDVQVLRFHWQRAFFPSHVNCFTHLATTWVATSLALVASPDDFIQSASVDLVCCILHRSSSTVLSFHLQPNAFMQTCYVSLQKVILQIVVRHFSCYNIYWCSYAYLLRHVCPYFNNSRTSERIFMTFETKEFYWHLWCILILFKKAVP
jgi:hypothetical protein